jgi:eukaryotic-like serine/threonine-protein kinase
MAENWQQIKDIFGRAIELPPAAREDFLQANCSGSDIYDEVKSLLDASDDDSEIIENDSFSVPNIFPVPKTYESVVFGHYRILREIGHGGMGTVFLVERNDGEFEQKAALKIIRQSFAGGEIERYFRRERQILASLNHPFIARLLDGGVSDRGELFFVMEYVEGVGLLEFCDEHDLSIESRLRLFLKVCRAVSFAHQNLVMHRDLKPSNILIDKYGEPKLLDFGLAKLATSQVSQNAESTRTAFRAFSPAYASPEQIMGKNITTASDVYSLGVIFYELLSDTKPFEFDGKSLDEIIRTLTDHEPPAPSTNPNSRFKAQSTQKSGLESASPKLHGDLDNIALKALERDVAQRYGSVEEFAADIERHLNGLPVSARAATPAYRASKFFRRNRMAVSASVFVILALATGLSIALWQADMARKERDRAEKRFNDVRKLSHSLLFEITPRIERLQGSTDARKVVVERALEYLDSLASESGTDAALLSELASAYEKIGELQSASNKPNLNDFAGAIASYQKAQKIREILPQTPENRQLLAQNYRHYAAAIFTQDDVKGSFEASRKSLNLYEQLLAEDPHSPELQAAYVETNLQFGTTFAINNKYAEAIPIFERSIHDLSGMSQTDREIMRLNATTLAQLGNALSWSDRQPEAEEKITESVKIISDLLTQSPNDTVVLRDAYRIYGLASSTYEDVKNDVSLEYSRKFLQVATHAAEVDPADSQARSNLARAYSRVGLSLINVKRLSDGIANLGKAQSELLEITADDPENVAYKRELAIIYVRFGDAHTLAKNYAAAIDEYQRSADQFENIARRDEKNTLAPRDLAQSLKNMGDIYLKINEPEKAKTAYQQASEILRNLVGQNALGQSDIKMFDEVQNNLRRLLIIE